MPVLENPRWERFAQALAAGKPASQSYAEAGYAAKGNSAEANASRLLRNAKVAARVQELQSRVTEGIVLTRQWVLEKLVENANRAMQARAVLVDGETVGEYRYEGSVANRALELLGKELGMFVDRKEVGQPGDFEKMSVDELRDSIARDLETVGRKDLAAALIGGARGSSGQPGGLH